MSTTAVAPPLPPHTLDPTSRNGPPGRAADPRLGTIIDGAEHRYRIDHVLGRGGFGAVYRATQLDLGRPVALKILATRHAEHPEEVARFEQEARIIGALDHPHIVKLVELGHTDCGTVFLAMELLDGESLGARIKRAGPLPEGDVIRLGRQILGALVAAHALGVVHRDLKLENLFVTELPGHGLNVKLLDFGIAKVTSPLVGSAPRTRAGLVVGSPRIMAPEQICGDPITAQTDLYAFGCDLYEMSTGRPPFVCRSTGAYARAHLTETPAWPVHEGLALSGPLAELTMQCLEKRPVDRPPSAAALLAAWPPDPIVDPIVVDPIVPGPARRRGRSWPSALATLVALASLVAVLRCLAATPGPHAPTDSPWITGVATTPPATGWTARAEPANRTP